MKLCPREGPLKAKNEAKINKIRSGYRSSNPFEGTSASSQPLRRSRRESKFKLAIFLVFYSTFLKNTVKHAFETIFLKPAGVSLMRFSSTNPIGGTILINQPIRSSRISFKQPFRRHKCLQPTLAAQPTGVEIQTCDISRVL